MPRLSPLLVLLAAAGSAALAADAAGSPGSDTLAPVVPPWPVLSGLAAPLIEGPDAEMTLDHGVGVTRYLKGFVARFDGRTLMGDALRYDLSRQELYATGHIVYRQPGLRLSADRLGLRRGLQIDGDAWQVEARVTYGSGPAERTVIITAERATIAGETITFHGVDLSLGNGSVLAFHAGKAHLYLRQPKPGEDPNEDRSYVEGVALVSPTGSVVGLPVFWFPYLYRDFSRRYPWTRVRGGYTKRLGTYGRFWIGSDLPEFLGWRTSLDGRVDRHSRSGNGFGSTYSWQHQTLGTGFAEWYRLPREAVRDANGAELTVRKAQALDVEHRVPLGGRGAAAGRFTVTPTGDPTAPGDPVRDHPPGLRFLSDYLWANPDRRALPRRGAALAYQLPFITVVGDTDRNYHPNQPDTERWFGLQAIATPQQLLGPVHLGGRGWWEDLHRRGADTQAQRLTWDGYLGVGQWLGQGFGFDAAIGDRGLGYLDGEIDDLAQDDAIRHAPYADGGVKVRIEKRYGTITHSLVPRLGVQLIGAGQGDDLPLTPARTSAYGFGDPRDQLEEDARYWVTQLDTRLSSDRQLFHAGVVARWAMREREREYRDDTGSVRIGPHPLVDVAGTADGEPLRGLTFTASVLYDARPRRFTRFDATTAWRAAQWLRLSDTSTLLPDLENDDRTAWAHTPGAALYANRYTIDGSLTIRPSGAPVDSWLVTISRQMVDGSLFIGYELSRDRDGALDDRRVSVGFSLVGIDEDRERDRPSGPRATLSR